MKSIYFAVLLSLLPEAARAQVFINQAALQQLADVRVPEVAPDMAGPAAKRHIFHRHVMAHVMTVAARPVPGLVALSKPQPVVQPVVAKPPPPVALPPLKPVTIAFAAGGTDFPSGAAALLQPVCARAGSDGLVTIDAYGAADGADVSAPMRTSLSRAFAVRDALAACGVPAAHIIARADGAAAGKDPQSAVVSLGVGGTGPGK